MPLFPSLPADATVKHVFESHAGIYAPFVHTIEAVMRGPSPLSPGQRELIAAYVSSLNACRYCFGGHRAAAEAFGIAPEVVDRLIADPAGAAVDDRFTPVLAYVKKLTQSPSRMTQADADAVFEAGWDEDALHSAVAVCCLFNFMNRLVDGHGVAADPAAFTARGRRHMELGYVRQYPELAAHRSGEAHNP